MELIPQPGGRGALQRGNPGNSGGGRPPDQFRAMCRELASSEAVRQNVARILANPAQYPQLYTGALKWASEHGYGKPTERVELTGADGAPVQVQVWQFGATTVSF